MASHIKISNDDSRIEILVWHCTVFPDEVYYDDPGGIFNKIENLKKKYENEKKKTPRRLRKIFSRVTSIYWLGSVRFGGMRGQIHRIQPSFLDT